VVGYFVYIHMRLFVLVDILCLGLKIASRHNMSSAIFFFLHCFFTGYLSSQNNDNDKAVTS
jgi:membrane-bound acyltransferase YfiQ involved in biofilm formation